MKKTIFFFLIFILLSGSTLAISLSGAPFRPNPRLFEPGMELSLKYQIADYRWDKAEPYLDGDLTEYAEITILQETDDTIIFQVDIELPESIDKPGVNTLFIGAREVPPNKTGMVVGVTRAQKAINIMVLYENKFAKFYGFSTPHMNQNETTNFSISAESYSKQDINNIWAEIEVYDFNDEIVKTLRMDDFNLPSAKKTTKKVEFDSIGLLAGEYSAEATVHWADNTTVLKSEFNIGQLEVELLNTSRNFTAGSINRIDMVVESGWNGRITNLYAELYVDGQEQTATRSYDLEAFETDKITGFLDLRDVDKGEHELEIILHFGRDQKSYTETINVLPDPDKGFELSNMSIIMFLTIIILILIIVILFLEYHKSRKK